jgi:hypothetical protein
MIKLFNLTYKQCVFGSCKFYTNLFLNYLFINNFDRFQIELTNKCNLKTNGYKKIELLELAKQSFSAVYQLIEKNFL